MRTVETAVPVEESVEALPASSAAYAGSDPIADADLPIDAARVAPSEMPDSVISASDPPPAGHAAEGKSLAGLLGSGLLGGLVGAGLALAAQALWIAPAGRIEERLDLLEQRAGSAASSQETVGSNERRLTAIEAEIKGLAERVRTARDSADSAAKQADAAANRPPPPPDPGQAAALAQAQTRLSAVERSLGEGASSAREAQTTLERRLAEQDQRLAVLTRQMAEGGPQRLEAVMRLVAADRIEAALREGRPLAPLLPIIERLKAPAPVLAALQPYRDAAAPSAAALSRDFKPIAETVAAGQRPQPNDWTGRLMGIAGEIVSIKPVDGGPDASGAAGRVEAALSRGDVTEAATAWDALPETARRSAAGFGETLKRRAAAEAALRQLSGEALSSFEAATR